MSGLLRGQQILQVCICSVFLKTSHTYNRASIIEGLTYNRGSAARCCFSASAPSHFPPVDHKPPAPDDDGDDGDGDDGDDGDDDDDDPSKHYQKKGDQRLRRFSPPPRFQFSPHLALHSASKSPSPHWLQDPFVYTYIKVELSF